MTGTIPASSSRMILAALEAASDGTQQLGSFVMTCLTRMTHFVGKVRAMRRNYRAEHGAL